MRLDVLQGSLQEVEADTLVVNLFEGVKEPAGATGALDRALDGAVRDLIDGGDFTGKLGETAVLYTRGLITARRVVLAGLGVQDDLDLEAVRRAAAAASRRARDLNAHHLATIVHGAGAGGLDLHDAAQATVEGTLLGVYRYFAPRKDREPSEMLELEALTVVEYDESRIEPIEAGARLAEAVVLGVILARNLVNMPPNVATPTQLAEVARDIAESHGMQVTIGDREWAAERRMGAFLAVARGAGEPPKFIILEHNAGREDRGTIVLVGKGITFDTGGISLKPRENLWTMKSDMAGAAAVLGAMKVVGMLDLPLRVVAIVPATENMPDAHAYHPADVITASNNVTIEIISTDAEGRMILSDALVWAGEYEPDAVVDLATLTGSSVIALGRGIAAGLFGNDDRLRGRLEAAAGRTHERVWPMPLYDEYKETIQSEVADIKNSGGLYGGVGTSAMFLRQFVDYPWAHVDMAGMALSDKQSGYIAKGGTGFGVRLLVDFLRSWPE